MASFSVFLSVVFVVRNQSELLEQILVDATSILKPLVSDYELIVIDNASMDESVSLLKSSTAQYGLPNLQVFALTKEVDQDTAFWVGLENALGDFVAVIDPLAEDLAFLPSMLEKAVTGIDVVFANNKNKPKQSTAYRFANAMFNYMYKIFHGINLAREAPQYRLLNRNVINFILQHPQPSLTYRHLPATGGFSRLNMEYIAKPITDTTKQLGDSIDRGMRLLVSTTRVPMRLVTMLSLFGAVANLIYSLYVVAVVLLKGDLNEGWASMSLQMSGMFFLISLVLFLLGEYVLQMASLSNEGPCYHVGQEFTSFQMTHRKRLNVEEVTLSSAFDDQRG